MPTEGGPSLREMGLNETDIETNKERQFQEEINRIKESAIAEGKMLYSKDGKFEYALAPNGEKSHLNEKQWLETRTSFFTNWFGDWENHQEGASKFIDENGEPAVLYHGTTRKFDTFSHEAPKTFDLDNVKGAFFLTFDKELAKVEYGNFKRNLIIDTLRRFNEVFFDEKAEDWSILIDTWNDFVRSIGSKKINFRKEVPDGQGGVYHWTDVEFNGKTIFPTEELEKIWDRAIPESFDQADYEIDTWEGKEILLPKNSKQIIMELFVNSRNPNYKEVKSGNDRGEVDNLFALGMIEKGIYKTSEQHVLSNPDFNSKPGTDSVAVRLSNGELSVAVFDSNQIKSANGNSGLFTRESNNIYE